MELHSKILNSCVHQAEFMHAAKILGILDKRNQVVIELGVEEDPICDFNIYENIRDGKSTLSLFAENYSSDDPLEKDLLNAMLQSEASLYEVAKVDENEQTLILNDVLNGSNKTCKLIDLSMSKTVKPNALVYTRLLHFEGFSMTTGLGFIFSENIKDYLLNRSRKMMKKMQTGDAPTNRFIAFFHLNRSDGLPAIFAEVN
jgi:hypothetical protein